MPSLADVGWLAPYLTPFITLSYPTDTPTHPDSFPDSPYYKTGPNDLWFMISCIAVMAVLRDTLRLCLFEPFARWILTRSYQAKREQYKLLHNGHANGVANGNGIPNGNGVANGNGHVAPLSRRKEQRKIHRSVLRFAEQGWQFVYYTTLWSYGFYIHRNVPTAVLNPTQLWLDYPHRTLAGPLKLYYLIETAFYTHQMLILNAEARRKDHWQMMTHHVITVFLMGASYYYNLTRIGCLIMVLMDFCDIILPLAKMLRYLEVAQTLCDTLFALFMVSWFVTRHILFLIAIWSTYEAPKIVKLQWNPETGHYLSRGSLNVFLACLIALQFLQMAWFATICRVAWNVVMGVGASDSRSDDEDFGETESEAKED